MSLSSATRVAAAVVGACVLALTGTVALAAGADSTFSFSQPLNPGSATLSAVSALSSSEAWAVGVQYQNQNTVIATLAEHWNGRTWSISPTVNPSSGTFTGDGLGGSDVLDGVAEVSPTNVWAVGYSNNSSPLIEHFDGSRWSQVPAPTAPNTSNEVFNAVAADSASDVWAVGGQFQAGVGGDVPLIEHFNGTSWTVVANSPFVVDSFGGQHVISSLSTVAAVSPTNVWAAGPDAGTGQAIFEHFDGSSWTVVPSPSTGQHMYINSLSTSPDGNVWAVGRQVGFGRRAATKQLIERFTAGAWSIVPGPAAGTGTAGALYSVTALSPTDVWAAGNDALPNGANAWQHFDGTAWTLLGVPSQMGFVRGLGSARAATVIAVGDASSSGLGALLSTNA